MPSVKRLFIVGESVRWLTGGTINLCARRNECGLDLPVYCLSRFCSGCLKTAAEMPRCSGCGKVSYCSEECQKKDWKKHKVDCKKN